jgi:hypothetical protein
MGLVICGVRVVAADAAVWRPFVDWWIGVTFRVEIVGFGIMVRDEVNRDLEDG